MSEKYNAENTNLEIQIRVCTTGNKNRKIKVGKVQVGEHQSENTDRKIQLGTFTSNNHTSEK